MSIYVWTSKPFRPSRAQHRRRWIAEPVSGRGVAMVWVAREEEYKHGWAYEHGWSREIPVSAVLGFAANDMALDPLAAEDVKSLAVALDRRALVEAEAEQAKYDAEREAEAAARRKTA